MGIGVFVYFCSLYGRAFVFSRVRLVGLAVGCALLLVPVVWMLRGPGSETTQALPSVVLPAVAFGFVLGIFALAVSCQRRKSVVGSAIGKYLNCKPR